MYLHFTNNVTYALLVLTPTLTVSPEIMFVSKSTYLSFLFANLNLNKAPVHHSATMNKLIHNS